MAPSAFGFKRMVERAVFFIGWVLSPLTFWNDAFVNIPIAYLFANLLRHVFAVDFLYLLLISYWLSNLLGLLLMYLAGKPIIKGGGDVLKEALKLIGTIIIYSLIVILLGKLGLVKPLI